MLLDPESNISDIVRSDYRSADILKKYQINYCCNGKISLQAACKWKGLNCDSIINEVEEATRNINLPNCVPFKQWKIDFLIDYIINVHHAYLYQTIPSLEAEMLFFMDGHKNNSFELKTINEILNELSNVLLAHNHYEEEIIFPYIKQIDTAFRRKESYGNLFVRTLRKPLNNIEKEHSLICELLRKLRLYTNNYIFPENACINHQVLYHKLREFHNDQVQHKHLENNILFPKAMDIEKHLLQV